MLGSADDADDALQESLLRAWRSIARFDGRRPLRPWLYAIATNCCWTAIDARTRRALPTDLSPGSAAARETAWLAPYPDARLDLEGLSPEQCVLARESVELAFLAAIQRLSALQRAVLVLREVLGFSASEVAEMLNSSVAAVNSALQRARRVLRERRPSRSQQQELAALGEQAQSLAARYAAAWDAGDLDAVVAMLADDARLAMPPQVGWHQGPAAVRAALAGGPFRHRWRLLRTSANGQLAFGAYRFDETGRTFVGEGVDVLTVREGRVAAIDAFLVSELEPYGLPSTIAS
jgi:RNA polymerase sigma-70 factor, ECF subfamily